MSALDVLDTSICLRTPDDYTPEDGARFTVHIEKGRGIHGEQARPFEARLEVVDGRAQWTMKEIEDVERTRVAALLATGLSIREIAEETGLHRSKVHRAEAADRGGGGGRRHAASTGAGGVEPLETSQASGRRILWDAGPRFRAP